MSSKRATTLFKKKAESALAKVQTQDEFRASDIMIEEVYKIGKRLFLVPFDQMSGGQLTSIAFKLSGIHAYLGNKASYARAERDVYEQKLSEVQNQLVLEYLEEGGEKYKVTQARAQAKIDVAGLEEIVIVKENEKNNYEHVLNAADRMVSFIQSAIRVKQSESYKTNIEG